MWETDNFDRPPLTPPRTQPRDRAERGGFGRSTTRRLCRSGGRGCARRNRGLETPLQPFACFFLQYQRRTANRTQGRSAPRYPTGSLMTPLFRPVGGRRTSDTPALLFFTEHGLL
jgi:hypothetical protein